MISYYFGGRAYHVPIMPHVHPTSSAVTYSLDEGKTKFFDLLQLVEFYQLNKGTLNSKLTHYIVTNSGTLSHLLLLKFYHLQLHLHRVGGTGGAEGALAPPSFGIL